MSAPILTPGIVWALEESDANYTISELLGLQSLDGNPRGVHFQRFGDALAAVCEEMPLPMWNRLLMCTAGTVDHLDDILEFFDDHGVSPRIDIVPALGKDRLLPELAVRGFHASDFVAVLYRTPTEDWPAPAPGVEILLVEDEDEEEAFADIFIEGNAIPPGLWDETREDLPVRMGAPEWRRYLATVDGEPAACAVLYSENGVGMLSWAATLPEFRGRGCQTALLHTRIAEAARMGLDLVTVTTVFLSPSQRNCERSGFRMAYTKTFWERL
jgi:GNAT superfamily N-acetyltransferase